ncbi:MAG TPA: alpha/beta hydrolase [Ideonella sp.]|uniref:alpha/beta fold hydrolase n=1 Tax=Ideonella sp. TaxID=1929293 RepID=UPI002E34F1E8|nr:alpha/beta hydrolase [Ideonella sp.]HEX5682975.1 alpha/beta hydrolase [Ideonella sp.]
MTLDAFHRHIAGPAGALFVDDGGQGGLPLLFVHSFAGNTGHWQAQLSHLRPQRRALAMDWRGHGESEPPEGLDYAIDSIAEDIAAVADALALPRFVLVGHSMGGAAAVAYAGAHRDRLAGLVLVGAPGRTDPAAARAILDALHTDYDAVMERYWQSLTTQARPSVHALLNVERGEIGRDATVAMIEAILAFDPLPALARYAGPALLIDTLHGDSPTALYRQARQLKRRMIGGTSHWPHLDDPTTFNQVLDEFLVKVDPHAPSGDCPPRGLAQRTGKAGSAHAT